MSKNDSYDFSGERRGPRDRKKKKPNGLKIFGIIVGLVFFVIAGVGLIGGAVAYGAFKGLEASTPAVESINIIPTNYPSTVVDIEGNEIASLSATGTSRDEATLSEITDYIKWAFIDIEDQRFYEHNGIDSNGILRAIYSTLNGTDLSGGSTITQQLLKNNVFESGGYERSKGSLIRRKVQEWVLALALEKEVSKDEILINYLNTIYLGGNCYGVKAAAQYYFDKELDELTLAEVAVIAATTSSPATYSPVSNPDNNRTRQLIVLDNMLQNGHITQAEYNEAIADTEVYDRITAIYNTENKQNNIYSYFVDSLVDSVMNDLQENLGYTYTQAYNALYTSGLTIYATQNPTVQNIVDTEMNDESNFNGFVTSWGVDWYLTVMHSDGTFDYYNKNHLKEYRETTYGSSRPLDFSSTEAADEAIADFKSTVVGEGDEITYEDVVYTLQPQASFTIMDYTTGQVLAISGGRGEKTTSLSLNRAVDTSRQPGSCFKIVAAYAPAIDAAGYTLATTIKDEETYYDTEKKKMVHNWWGDTYRGWTAVRICIRDSMNVCAVKTVMDIGANLSIDYLVNRFSFTTIDEEGDANAATALGGITNGVTNLELCAAYSAIANKGTYMEPIFYTKIVDHDGNLILDKTQAQDVHEAVKETTASLLTSAMRDVVTSGTGTSCNISGTPVAGKTGTTTATRDLWFCGFVPNGLCGCVWTGFDDNYQMSGSEVTHEVLYSNIMGQVVEALGLTGGSFEMTGGITTATVCTQTGMLPRSGCPTKTEYFATGTVPTTTCTGHDGSGGDKSETTKKDEDKETTTTKKDKETTKKASETTTKASETTTKAPETTTTAPETTTTAPETTTTAPETTTTEAPTETTAPEAPAETTATGSSGNGNNEGGGENGG